MKLKYFILGLVFINFQCKENSSDPESPFSELLSQADIKIDTVKQSPNVWEYGFRFVPLANGVIDKLAVIVPTEGEFLVKLYDLDANKVLVQKMIMSLKAGLESPSDITPITVKSGSNLALSIVADVFFESQNINGAPFNFPITKNNISIISFHEEICGKTGCPKFPTLINNVLIKPCVDIRFTKSD